MRTFKIIRDPYRDKEYLYKKKTITLEEGITVFVGCNGSGKTTLIRLLKQQLESENIPVIHFDNLVDGGSNARSRAAFYEDYTFLAKSFSASEGESIKLNLGNFARKLGYFCLTENKEASEIWILMDAVDSGFSIDNIVEIKEFLFGTILEHKAKDQKIYIVISANEYELVRGENCLDIQEGKYRQFKTYEAFRKFILKSREKRDAVMPK